MMTDEQAKQIAHEIDHGIDALLAAPREDKVKIVKAYLDEQIGTEVDAELKAIPGLPMLSGAVLEMISDAALDAVAALVVKKWFPGA